MTESSPGRGEQDWTDVETLAGGSEPSARRRYGRAAGLVAGGALAGAVIAGSLPAIAGSTASPSPSSPGYGHAQGDRPGGHARGDEKPLTGATADKVRAAALAKVPGATVDRLETDADGAAYEAHLTKTDGTHVTVKLDKSFAVTAVETGGPGGRGFGHGRGGEKPLTGSTADKVRAAALAKVPGATVDRLETDADGAAYEAHLTKTDGTHVTVKLDTSFAVTAVETGGPGGPRGHDGPGGPPPSRSWTSPGAPTQG